MSNASRFETFCLLELLLGWQTVSAQSPVAAHHALSSSAQVDSVFTRYFAELEVSINNQQNLSIAEQQFLMLTSFMAGTTFYAVQCYGPNTITGSQLATCKKWYKMNRTKISYLKLKRGFKLLNEPVNDAAEIELESLKIK